MNLTVATREVRSKRYLQHQPAALLAEVLMANGLAQDHRHKLGRTAIEGMRHKTEDHPVLIVLLGVDMTDGQLRMTTDRRRRRHQESDDRTGAMVQRADQDIFLHHLARVVILCQTYLDTGPTEATGGEALQQAVVMSTYRVTTDHDGRGNPTRGNDVALETLETREKGRPTTGRIEVGPTATGNGIDQTTLETLLEIEEMAGLDPEVQNVGTVIAMTGTMTFIGGVSRGA
jgi:hypothetical protein